VNILCTCAVYILSLVYGQCIFCVFALCIFCVVARCIFCVIALCISCHGLCIWCRLWIFCVHVLFIFCHLYTGGVYSVCLRCVYSMCLRCVHLAMGCVYSVGVTHRLYAYCGCRYCVLRMCSIHMHLSWTADWRWRCRCSYLCCVTFPYSCSTTDSYIYAMTRLSICVCHAAFWCVTWRVHIQQVVQMYYPAFVCVTWLIRIYDMTHLQVCHGLFICVTARFLS